MATPLPSLALMLLAHCAPTDPSQAAPPAAPASPVAPVPTSAAFDHSELDALLKKHGRGDRIDYAALKTDRTALDGYLDRIAKLPADAVAKMERAEQMAFWINAYNAWTLRTIVDAYPIAGSGLSGLRFPKNSIRQLSDPWGTKHPIAGAQRSLDDLEHKILRAQFKDPRIHSAVNCASVGCPPLRLEAFAAATLEAQLDDQMRKFLADPKRNLVDPAKKKIELSSIFDWFGEDFGTKATGAAGERALLAWIEKYGKPEWKEFLSKFDPDDVDFLDYDWALNDVVQ